MLRSSPKPGRKLWLGLAALVMAVVCVCLVDAFSAPDVPFACVNSICFSPDGKFLLVARSVDADDPDDPANGYRAGFQILDVKTKSVYESLPYEKPLNPLVYAEAYYSSDGKFIVVSGTGRDDKDGAGAGSTVVYDTSNFEPKDIKPPKEAGGYIGDVDQKVFWGSKSFAKTIKTNSKITVSIKTSTYSRLVATKAGLAQLKLNSLQHLLAITGSSGQVSVVNLKTGRIIGHFSCLVQDREERAGAYYDSTWFPKQNLLLTTNQNNRFVFWDATRCKVMADVTLTSEVTCSALSKDGNSLALGFKDGRVQILTAAELGKLVSKGSAHIKAFFNGKASV